MLVEKKMSVEVKAEAIQVREPKLGKGIARFFKVIDKRETTLPACSQKDFGTDGVTNNQEPDLPSPVSERGSEKGERETLKPRINARAPSDANDSSAATVGDLTTDSSVKSPGLAQISAEQILTNVAWTTKPVTNNSRSKTKQNIGGSRKRKKCISVEEDVTYVSYVDFKKQNTMDCIDSDGPVGDDGVVVKDHNIEIANHTLTKNHSIAAAKSNLANGIFKTLKQGDSSLNKAEDGNDGITNVELPPTNEPTIADRDMDSGSKLKGTCSGNDKAMLTTSWSHTKSPKSLVNSEPELQQSTKSLCKSSSNAKKSKRRKSLVDDDSPLSSKLIKHRVFKPPVTSKPATTDCNMINGPSKFKKRSSAEGTVTMESSRRHKKPPKCTEPELPYVGTSNFKKTKRHRSSFDSDLDPSSIIRDVPVPYSKEGQDSVRRSPRLRKVLTMNDVDNDLRANRAESLKSRPKNHGGKHSTSKSSHKLVTGSSSGVRNSLKKALLRKKKSMGNSGPLAPMFLKKTKKPISKMDAAMLEKRKSFLMSGIPEKLQKQIQLSDVCNINCAAHTFTTIKHLQQKGISSPGSLWDLKVPEALACFSEDDWINSCPNGRSLHYGTLTKCTEMFSGPKLSNESSENQELKLDVSEILDEIQQNNTSLDTMTIYQGYVQKRRNAWLNETNDEIPISEPKGTPECITLEDEEISLVRKPKVLPQAISVRKGKRVENSNKGDGKDADVTQLRSSKADDLTNNYSSDLWTTVYQPEAAKDVVGNAEAVVEVSSWLKQWKTVCLSSWRKEQASSNRWDKKRKKTGFSQRDSDYDSGSDGSDNGNDLCNTVLLVGPNGCGKTSTVFALAKEQGFEVIEVNAATKRTGKLVLSRLREATQSHNVNDLKSVNLSPTKVNSSFFTSKDKRKNFPTSQGLKVAASTKSPEKCEVSRPTPVSLILFEDVDIVFAEDDGFWSAVNSFMSSAKRPIILTTSDTMFAQRGCIKENYIQVKFHMPDPSLQVLHLQLIALAEQSFCSSKDLICLIENNSGDYRKSLLTLEFYSKHRQSKGKINSADICSKESNANNAKEKLIVVSAALNYLFSDCHSLPDFGCTKGLGVGKLFAAHAELLDVFESRLSKSQSAHEPECKSEASTKLPCLNNIKNLDRISNFANKLVDLDVASPKESLSFANNSADVAPGLEDEWPAADDKCQLHLRDASIGTFVNLQHFIMRAGRSIQYAIETTDGLKASIIRPQYSCDDEPHNVLSAMPLDTRLHRRDFYLDYLPVLRNICHTESVKVSASTKRRGRFAHYFSSNVLYLKTDTIGWLGTHFQGEQL